MVLSNYKVGAGLAVSDMGRAREFYEGKLGLTVSIDSPDNVQYRCAQNSVLHIYLSPADLDAPMFVNKASEIVSTRSQAPVRG
jgi:hypothetical protein